MSGGINNFQGWNLFKNLMSQTSSGNEVNRDEFQKIMNNADTNNDGIVTEDEFRSSFNAHKSSSSDEELYADAYKLISSLDGDLSALSCEELNSLLKKAGIDSTKTTDDIPPLSDFKIKNDIVSGFSNMVSSLQTLQSDLSPVDKTEISEIEESVTSDATSSPTDVQGSGSPITSPQAQQPVSPSLDTVGMSYDNMSLEELNAEKMSQQTSVNSARSDLSQLYISNGQVDEAKMDYEEAVANDEQISEELKQQSTDNLNAIAEKDSVIGELKSSICTLDGDIASAQSQINSLSADISAYQSAVSTLSAQQSDDPETQAAIAGQLQAAQAALAAAEAQKQAVEHQLAQLNTEKADLTEQLGTAETELGELQNQRAEIEQAISENCGEETKEAMQKYNEARNQFKTDVQNAEVDLKTMQSELDRINSAIDTKRAEQIKKDNRVSTTSDLFFEGDVKSEYIEKDGIMPYGLISPENIDPNVDYPVLVMLHGQGEAGGAQGYFMQNGVMKAVTENELANFNGYIICPHMTGDYHTRGWDNPESEAQIRTLISDFSTTHNVDTSRISLAGHSWGGQGALYLADKMGDVFSNAVVMSPYSPNDTDINNIKIPVRAYVGSNYNGEDKTTRNYTNGELAGVIGQENVFEVGASHGDVPSIALGTDTNGNGCPDAYEWMFG